MMRVSIQMGYIVLILLSFTISVSASCCPDNNIQPQIIDHTSLQAIRPQSIVPPVQNGNIQNTVSIQSSQPDNSAAATLDHTITFNNYCEQDIYVIDILGPQGHFDDNTVCSACSCGGKSKACCPSTICSGTICNGTSCGLGTPLPEGGGFKIESQTGSKTITGVGQWWEGAFWGRNACNELPDGNISCGGAPCKNLPDGNDTIQCGGAGATPPATKFEVTFDGGLVNPTAPDVYDLSFVDGFNVPVKMEVVPGTYENSTIYGNASYYCTASGTAVDLNSKFKTSKLSRDKLAVLKDGSIVAFYSACSYYSTKLGQVGSDLANKTCCQGNYGSKQDAPIHNNLYCDPDKYWPTDVDTASFFKKYYPKEYSYAYDDFASTFQCKGKTDQNTQYIISFCKPANETPGVGTADPIPSWQQEPAVSGIYSWQHPLGGSDLDYGESIEQTTDGGYIIAGYTYSIDGDVTGKIDGQDQSDFWIIKLDSKGFILWETCLGGTDEEEAYDVIGTSDGGYLVCGFTFSDDVDVTGKIGGTGNSDFWIVKLNGSGGIEWRKCYGGSNDDVARNVVQTTDGGYIITGFTYSDDVMVSGKTGGTNNADFWVIKIDPSGVLIWQKCYGGSSDDYAEGVSEFTDGYLISGDTSSNDGLVSGNHGERDYWVIKTDPSGNLLWQSCFGGSGDDIGFHNTPDGSGGGAVVGYSRSTDGQVTGNHGSRDVWVVRFDATGTLVWERSYGGSESDEGYEISKSSSGGYFIGGASASSDGDLVGNYGGDDLWTFSIDYEGLITWQRSFGGTLNDIGTSLSIQSDGTIAACGYSDSNNIDVIGAHGRYDMWVLTPVIGESPSSIPLGKGWNFVSVPKLLVSGNNTGAIFENVKSEGHSVLTYDPETSWKILHRNDSVLPLYGYWVYSAEEDTIPVMADEEQEVVIRDLTQGWTAIGYGASEPLSARDMLISVKDQWSYVVGYDPDRQMYEEQIIKGGTGPYTDLRYMNPYLGYWLYMSDSGNLTTLNL